MKRRKFLNLGVKSAGALMAGSSVATFLASCNKSVTTADGGMLMQHSAPLANAVTVKEGPFTSLLSLPNQTRASGTLTAQQTFSTIKSSSVKVLGYQPNSMLGPTIRVKSGNTINYILQNNLNEATNIHWHGLKIPAAMDGYPMDTVKSKGNFIYQFQVNQRAGLCWYHPHPENTTAKQVFLGLAGMFIINDAEEAALNLPNGLLELPLVIQDKKITSTALTYAPTMMDIMTGYMGETITVNGIWAPLAKVSSRWYRLRLLNGSNARIYNLTLSNNADMIIIGNDGGLIQTPVHVKSILLAPAERLDVLVNFGNLPLNTEVYLQSKLFTGAGASQGSQAFNIMKFRVDSIVVDTFIMPATLSAITVLNESSAIRTRNFDISNNGMMMQHTINGKVFNAARIDENPVAGTTEVWIFENSLGGEAHRIHIHGIQFQVISRTGGRNQLPKAETGWKDTILILPKEKLKIIIPFGTLPGKFVFHCHNLEHEDDGMMLQYQIS